MSKLEDALAFQLRALKLSFCQEWRFAAHHVGLGKGIRGRLQDAGLKDWRFDFAFAGNKFAVEVEGGLYVNGRHSRGKGFEEDLRKYAAAMELGWTVYRCSGGMVSSGEAVKTICKMLEVRNG